jgi:hypothetical protein
MIALWVMAQISRRFGEVTHRPPLYRGFYVALALVGIALVARLLAIGLPEDQSGDLSGNHLGALLHDVPLAAGVTLGVAVAWRYWGWLIYAREGQSPVIPRHTPK